MLKKYRKKPVVVETITFDNFVQYAKENSEHQHWSFEFKGHPITHENDECYLISTLEGSHNFTPNDILIIGVQGELYPCKLDIFEATYEEVK